MNEGNDDFLWECAMKNNNDCIDWLVPDKYDESRNFYDRECNKSVKYIKKFVNDSETINKAIDIIISEFKDDKLDIIGGEVWEASFLLSVYLINHKDKYINRNVLELGCGVGLPSLLLVELNNRYLHSVTITMTDNDSKVIENIASTILINYDNNIITGDELYDDNIFNGNITIKAHTLDWNDFVYPDSYNNNTTTYGSCDLLIGSALCYSPYHSCLADVIKYYLLHSVKEVIIIQIKERPGFDKLINRLNILNIKFELLDYPNDYYEQAKQCISYQIVNDSVSSNKKIKKISFDSNNISNNIICDDIIRAPRESFVILKATSIIESNNDIRI